MALKKVVFSASLTRLCVFGGNRPVSHVSIAVLRLLKSAYQKLVILNLTYLLTGSHVRLLICNCRILSFALKFLIPLSAFWHLTLPVSLFSYTFPYPLRTAEILEIHRKGEKYWLFQIRSCPFSGPNHYSDWQFGSCRESIGSRSIFVSCPCISAPLKHTLSSAASWQSFLMCVY